MFKPLGIALKCSALWYSAQEPGLTNVLVQLSHEATCNMFSVAQHYCTTTLLLLVIVHYHCRAQEPGLTNVLVQLSHEGLAEAGDLANRLALGVEVGASLASPHGQSG